MPTTSAEITATPQITDEHGRRFREQGFMVIRDALCPAELDALRAETVAICRGARGSVRGLEPSPADATDDDILRRYLAIHFPHKISALMFDLVSHPVTVQALRQAIGPNVKSMQSMLFIKAAGKPGQAWHQDEFFIPTRDRSLTGAWLAIDDATVENGCLWVIPGSHRHGILWPQRAHDDIEFDCTGETYQYPYKDDDAIPVEMRAGSLLLFNGYLLHRSLPNRATAGYRRALVNHYMSAESLLPWQTPKVQSDGTTASIGGHDFRDIVLVSGVDPHAYKGTEDLNTPHIRPTGEGGRGNEYRNLGLGRGPRGRE